MLEVSGLTKTYGGTLAVKDVSFAARPGQVVGFLGPNGSGKTTSIRVLTGLLRATRGRVCWNGTDIQHQLLHYQSRLGYVPEEPHLYQYLTAPEYLELVGGLRDIPQATVRRRIDQYLELFHLDTDRYAPLSSFSKGMRQKVLLSAALLHDPDVVVFDEPCWVSTSRRRWCCGRWCDRLPSAEKSSSTARTSSTWWRRSARRC